MSRPISQSSSATTNVVSRTMSVKTSSKIPTLNPIPVSDVRLFVTNLRLLQLDLRDDWPDITVQTFSAKNADQKQRISATEWALFHLFQIWDPNETAQKLQPFFPPLEPLQSLNLRAALYRCLNELKKTGVPGREFILRKTMLDECKGEKFYEVLSLFSNTVLKKVLAARKGKPTDAAVARELAIASTLSPEKQQSLLPLAIAHRGALINILRHKEEKRLRLLEFERLLNTKLDDVNSRTQKSKDTPQAQRPAVPPKEAEAAKKQLKDNWIGNQKWLDIMLHGDDVQPEDAFLNNRFEKVWQMVETGQKLEDAAPEAGLLENLQSRVQEQQTRLQKWKDFHDELREDNMEASSTSAKAPAAPKQFKFDSHLGHQLPSSKQIGDRPVQRQALRPAYQDILLDMDHELSRVVTAKPKRPTITRLAKGTSSSFNASQTLVKSETNLDVGSKPKLPAKPALPTTSILPKKKPPPIPPKLVRPILSSTNSTAAPVSVSPKALPTKQESPAPEAHDAKTPSPASSPLPATDKTPSPSRDPAPTYALQPPTPMFEPPSLDPEEALAEQIIDAMGNATPSPVKKPQPRMSMSLMERTRMTLSRTPSFDPYPVPESPDLSLPTISAPESDADADADVDRTISLVERTRLTMATRPRASLAANTLAKDTSKSRSRDSLFPVNQFDTPRTRRSFELMEQSKSSEKTPKETLFSDEVDYDRVFKSRPRIATSPIFSPTGDGDVDRRLGEFDDDEFEGEVTGIDLADVDRSEDEEDGEGFTMAWKDSPSRRAGATKGVY